MADKILIVEDDRATNLMMCEALITEGYEVVDTATLDAALNALANDEFCVVLCDSLTHVIENRYTNLNLIQQAAPETPVIIVTAHHRVWYEDYHDHGFAGVLFKPFDIINLLDLVNLICANHEQFV